MVDGSKARTKMNGKQGGPPVVSDVSSTKKVLCKSLTILNILTVICVVVGSLLYGAKIAAKVPEAPKTTERSEAMFLTKQNSTTNNEIPAINTSAPVKTETATFALG
jgi:hypothetical protein